jgi:hypothetical protein
MTRAATKFERVQVPTELMPLLQHAGVREVHDRWQHVTVNDVREAQETARTNIAIRDGRVVQVGYFKNPDRNTDIIASIALPHQQELKPAMTARALMAQDMAAAVLGLNMDVVVFPNNGSRNIAYTHTLEELVRLTGGNRAEHAQMRARTLEALRRRHSFGAVFMSSYSAEGRDGLEIAAGTAPNFELVGLNIDEMPSKPGRDADGVQRDFLRSGGYFAQLGAIRDSGVPVMSRIYNPASLAADYVRFGLAAQNDQNKALRASMAGDAGDTLRAARRQYPDLAIKFGQVVGSNLFVPEGDYPGLARVQEYHSPRLHTTGDNIVAHALMVVDGLQHALPQLIRAGS